MSYTALIIRPADSKPVHVLECDGPNPNVDPIINYSPRLNLPPMSFKEWEALPDHVKFPRHTNPSNQDHDSACRIGRLLINAARNKSLPDRHLREIFARLELLHPGSTVGCGLTAKLTA